MKKKNLLLAAAAALCMTILTSITAFAGQWIQEGNIWKYLNDDGSYSANRWQWIDGNGDGIAECYCFGPDCVMYAGATTPDGWTVNADGAWIKDGAVQIMVIGQPEQPSQTDAGNPSGTAQDNASASDANVKLDYAYKVLDLVNQEREAYGRRPLEWAEDVAGLAQIRAKEIVEHFEHERTDGRKWSTIFTDEDMYYTFIGENIAYGQRTPETVVAAWMNSPGHKENILRTEFKEIGVGCYYDNGIYYWVQLFIAR